jgi:chaperonin GroES
VAEKKRAGVWLDVELGQAPDAANDDQAPLTFLEQHRLWDLDGDDYPEPYIVTVHKESQRVVRVVARYDQRGIIAKQDGTVVQIKPVRCFTKYPFIPSPDGSFYDIGFGTLLGALGETINTTINQLMDAGHLANVQGGFIGAGVSIKAGNLRFQPGEWKRVEAAGSTVRDAIVPLPVKEPSGVLFSLLEMLIEASKDVTATQNILTGDMGSANQPVGTTLAVIEQGLKTFTAIVKRIHRALKQELACLYDLNARYLNPQAYFTFQDEEGVIAQQDYAEGDCDVVPVSDPSMATDMQKMGRAQFLMQFLGKGLNDAEIVRRVLEAASIPDIKELEPKGPPPPDPQLVIESAKLEVQHRQVAVSEHEAETKRGLAEAQIASTSATAQKTMAEAILLLPEFQLQVAQLVDQRAREMMKAEADDGGQPPQVHPEDLSGMAGPPADGGLSPVPVGPEGPAGEPVGAGPGDGQPPPDEGAPPGGVLDPGMG